MKVKNVAWSLVGLVTVTVGLSHAVLAATDSSKRDVMMDLTNAVQHIEAVKLIDGSNSSFLKNAGSRLLGIETKNFIISKEGAEINNINGSSFSNILGGIKNTINGGEASTILGGQSNTNNGSFSTILGGNTNTISNGQYSAVIGGSNNNLGGEYSVIIGGNENEIDGDYSTVLGSNALVVGDNSLALGNNSKVRADNSFLWTDGSGSQELTNSNVFAVRGQHGMVVNTGAAHPFAKLTIGGSLVVDEGDSNVSCEPGVLKIVTGKTEENNSHKCFCSCNGDGYWHSLYGQGRCEGICNSAAEKQPVCGEKYNDCSDKFVGSCIDSKPAAGTGAYFVDSTGEVRWTCQTDAGLTKKCHSHVKDSSLSCS